MNRRQRAGLAALLAVGLYRATRSQDDSAGPSGTVGRADLSGTRLIDHGWLGLVER